MTSLSVVHKNRDESATDIVPRKTYYAGLKEFYVEPGYNVREIDQQHVEEFRDAFIAGEEVPALIVQVTEQGLKIVDGHHRYYGAVMATEAGHEVARLECKDAKGTEADRIALMVTSSQGRALLPLERAAAYQRLLNQGWTESEIAKKVKRSVADVEHHIQLLECGDTLIEMVKAKEIAATTAVSLSREHGTKAGSVATESLAKAKAAGKKKLTKAAALPQFSAVKARRLVELMAQFEFTDDGYTAADEIYLEAMGILGEYRDAHGKPASPSAAAEIEVRNSEIDEPELPVLNDEILSKSGIEVWGCIAAAFGHKSEYTFSESKYAHTWAADSVEHPEYIVVPAETIAKALRFIKSKKESLVIKAWVNERYSDPEQRIDMLHRLTSVSIEIKLEHALTVPEFIDMMESVDKSCWTNARQLRQAFRDLIEKRKAESAA